MKLVKISVPVKQDIIGRIAELAYGFETMYGKRPDAIALGPNEYLSLVSKATELAQYQAHEILYAETILGFPIELKTEPGISLILKDKRFAHCLARGVVSP